MPKPRPPARRNTKPNAKPNGSPGAVQREPPLGDGARHAAFRALARQVKTFPDFALGWLDDEVASLLLNAQDAAFAHAIYDAAVRRWLTLEFLIGLDLAQPFAALEPRVRAALLGGAAQILFLDRVPPHAAINHAVEWAKALVRPGAGGLVNAVLRKVAARRGETASHRDRWERRPDELPLSDGRALALTAPCLPGWEHDPLAALGIATSHPRVLLDQWLRQFPLDVVTDLSLHSLATPPIVLHTAHADASELASLGPLTTPHASPRHRVFTGDHASLAALLRSTDRLWVQDPSSSHAVDACADSGLRPRLILDLCAGSGTKTRQLARRFPDARIVATDVDADRLRTLQSVFAGSAQVAIASARSIRDPSGPLSSEIWGRADLILLDVPCSNTGVLPRRPEARYRFSDATLGELTAMQRQIIADAIPLLAGAAEGRCTGRILYSTCSLEPQENHAQAAWATRWHRLKPSGESLIHPRGQPGAEPAEYRDGAFSVLLG